MSKKMVGYVRMSTDKQEISPEMQREKIIAYCKLHDLTLYSIEQDLGISAKDIEGRPGFQNALDLILLKGEADGLVVWKLDRAFRSTKDAIGTAEQFNKRKKAMVSINESIDTTSAMGEFFFTLTAALGQMERKLIGERTRIALQTKIRNGERVGSVRMGFNLGEDGKTLVKDPREQEIMSLAKDYYDDGFSLRAISGFLADLGFTNRNRKPFSPSTIATMIKEIANDRHQ